MRTPPYLPFLSGPARVAPQMKPIDSANWLTPDSEADDWLEAKRTLMRDHRGEVFFQSENAGDVAADAANMVREHIGSGDHIESGFETELEKASALVSDDLCVMTEQNGAYCLSAVSLCAPTFWTLAEKAGQPLAGLHSPVPGGDPELAGRIQRIFQAVQPGKVLERMNWTVQLGGDRFTPSSDPMKKRLAELASKDAANDLFLRVERQTIRKLSDDRSLLFTIRVCVDQLAPVLEDKSHRKAFEEAWNHTHPDLATYKGWPHYERAVRFLLS